MVFPDNVGRAFKQRPTNVGIRTSMLSAKSAQMKKRTGSGFWGGLQIQNKKHEASLIGGFNPSERYKSQLGWLFPTYGKSKKSTSSTKEPPLSDCKKQPLLVDSQHFHAFSAMLPAVLSGVPCPPAGICGSRTPSCDPLIGQWTLQKRCWMESWRGYIWVNENHRHSSQTSRLFQDSCPTNHYSKGDQWGRYNLYIQIQGMMTSRIPRNISSSVRCSIHGGWTHGERHK